jgi:hypothetical protein
VPREAPRPVPYADLRDRLDSGDLVLFSGKSDISEKIKFLTRGSWSHVGMVVRTAPAAEPLLWESSTLVDVADVDLGRPNEGVQLVPFADRLATYEGDVAVRQLVVKRTPVFRLALEEVREEMRGRPYECRQLEMFRSAYDGPFGTNYEDLSSLFCSELVAEAYQRLALLPPDRPSNEYTPKDFSSERRPRLRLLGGARLGKEVLVNR